MTASPHDVMSRSYIWTHPSCPVQVLLAFDVINRLDTEIRRNATVAGISGGFLIARERSDPGRIEIVDFILSPPDRNDSGPYFGWAAARAGDVAGKCPPGTRVAGCFRANAEPIVHLRATDLEGLPTSIHDPTVFLVIATKGGDATAGCFVRARGVVGLNANLTFPWSPAKLINEGWPTASGSGFGSRLRSLTSQAGQIFKGGNAVLRLAGLTVVLTSLIAIVLLVWNRPITLSKTAGAAPLGLQVHRDGTAYLVSWDRAASNIATAKDANLMIWDESRAGSQGSEPLLVPLKPSQLQLGSLMYRSLSATEKVKFRLEVKNSSGSSFSDAVVSFAASPGAGVASNPQAATAHKPASPQSPAGGGELANGDGRSSRGVRVFVPPPPRSNANTPVEIATLKPPEVAIPPKPPPDANAVPLHAGETNAGKTIRQPDQGLITITSEPSGANVEINSVPAGITPLTLQVKPIGLGFTVTVSKDGFAKWTVQTFSTVRPYALHAQLKRASK